jgi:hypothetical protein
MHANRRGITSFRFMAKQSSIGQHKFQAKKSPSEEGLRMA